MAKYTRKEIATAIIEIGLGISSQSSDMRKYLKDNLYIKSMPTEIGKVYVSNWLKRQ